MTDQQTDIEPGYIYIPLGDHPWVRKSGVIGEHVKVMEKHIGRRIRRNEVVHHKNEDRSDNRFQNLQLMTRVKHTVLHRSIHPKVRVCKACGSEFRPNPTNRANQVFCDRKCAGAFRSVHPKQRDCAVCGRTFVMRPKDRSRQRSCGMVCGDKLRLRTRRENIAAREVK